MPDYKKMYLTLFAATEDVLDMLDMLDADSAAFRESFLPIRIKTRLTQAQRQCEDIYMGNEA